MYLVLTTTTHNNLSQILFKTGNLTTNPILENLLSNLFLELVRFKGYSKTLMGRLIAFKRGRLPILLKNDALILLKNMLMVYALNFFLQKDFIIYFITITKWLLKICFVWFTKNVFGGIIASFGAFRQNEWEIWHNFLTISTIFQEVTVWQNYFVRGESFRISEVSKSKEHLCKK